VIQGRFLSWTGNSKTIAAVFGLGVLGCLMALSVEPLEWIDLNRAAGPWILITGLVLGFAAFGGLCVFVRCPRCRTRLIWHAVSRDAHPIALNGLMAAARCPWCDFPSAPEGKPQHHIAPSSARYHSTGSHAGSADDVTSLEGPVEKIDGKLTLRIPLQGGGDQFVQCARGISRIADGCLVIVIQEWLAGTLRIEEGDLVAIDNADGKFNIRAVKPRSVH
jgi:hypothetical protein